MLLKCESAVDGKGLTVHYNQHLFCHFSFVYRAHYYFFFLPSWDLLSHETKWLEEWASLSKDRSECRKVFE